MSLNKDANNLDASIAGEVNICNIFRNESVNITFKNEDSVNWDGDYKLYLYNSKKKNTQVEIPNALQVNGDELILTIEPETQDITADNHYYEIFDTTTKRIEFLGELTIEI